MTVDDAVAQTAAMKKMRDSEEEPILRHFRASQDVKKLDLHQMSVIYHCQKMTCMFFAIHASNVMKFHQNSKQKPDRQLTLNSWKLKKIAHLTENEWRIWI